MCRFWALALGYVEEAPPEGSTSWQELLESNEILVPPDGSIGAIVDTTGFGPRILFLRVPEAKSAKNRIHLDVSSAATASDRGEKVAQLIGAGATKIRQIDENQESWVVLVDPEGNEFCVT